MFYNSITGMVCRFKGDEIHFNLMAIVADKKVKYGEQKDTIQLELAVSN